MQQHHNLLLASFPVQCSHNGVSVIPVNNNNSTEVIISVTKTNLDALHYYIDEGNLSQA